MIETPALNILVRDPVKLDGFDSLPEGCSTCPFGKNSPGSYPFQGDRADFDCELLKAMGVWGTHPICTMQDWRKRARVELAALLETK